MQGYQISRGGNGPVGITSLNATIADSASHTVALAAPANQVKIRNYDTSHPLYVSFYGPATTNNYGVAPGAEFVYDGPAVTQLFLNSNGNSVNFGIFAV